MICKYCGAEMQKDDVDFNFKGNKDIYWVCNKCKIGCVEKIRYSKQWVVVWDEMVNKK